MLGNPTIQLRSHGPLAQAPNLESCKHFITPLYKQGSILHIPLKKVGAHTSGSFENPWIEGPIATHLSALAWQRRLLASCQAAGSGNMWGLALNVYKTGPYSMVQILIRVPF